jgi:hypothetical protein
MALSACHWKDGSACEHPLLLEQDEGYADSILLHILWFDRDLMVPFLQVNLGENRAAGCLGSKTQHVGQRVDIRLRYQVEQATKVAAHSKPRCPHVFVI